MCKRQNSFPSRSSLVFSVALLCVVGASGVAEERKSLLGNLSWIGAFTYLAVAGAGSAA